MGVGWNGGYCGHCDHCRRGDFFACVTGQVTGITLRRRLRRVHDRPGERGRARCPPELSPVEARPVDVRRPHDVQRAAQQRRAAGRPRRRARPRRARPPRRPVRREDGLPHGRHRAGKGQGAARAGARRVGLHRQPGRGSCRGAARARRREGDPRDRDQRRSDERRPGRPGRQRHADDPRSALTTMQVVAAAASLRAPLDQGLVFRHVDRLAGHARVQRPHRRSIDERGLSRWSASPRLTTA